MLSFSVGHADRSIIKEIGSRASKRFGKQLRRGPIDFIMDISATHASGCPLRLTELRDAPEFDFAHDVLGICRHLDRETGQLGDCFVPRYASKEAYQCE